MRTTQRTDERILSSDIFDRDDKRPPRPDSGFWDEPGRRIPIYHRCDVLVVGGGPSGTAAAAAAARKAPTSRCSSATTTSAGCPPAAW